MKFRILEHPDGFFFIEYKRRFRPFWIKKRKASSSTKGSFLRRNPVERFSSMAEALSARDALKGLLAGKKLEIKIYSCSGDRLS